MSSNAGPVLPVAWAEILEKVEKTLTDAAADANRSEQELGSPEELPAQPTWQKAFDQLEERFRRLQGCLAEAELNAAQTEKSLQNSETTLQRWLAEAEAMRQKLVSEAKLSVS